MTETADPSWYWPVFWLMWAAGVVPSLYFLVTWFKLTTTRFSMNALDASGWIAALLLAYGRSGFVILAGDTSPPEFGAALGGLVIFVLIDALMWLRAVNWWRVQHRT